MFFFLSAVLLLGPAIYGLWRFGGLPVSYAVPCTLYGLGRSAVPRRH
ncbi:hypothetical protein [Streptomyces sp. URMC 129]